MDTKGHGDLALLIDADNVSSKHIKGIIAEVAKYSAVTSNPWRLDHSKCEELERMPARAFDLTYPSIRVYFGEKLNGWRNDH